MAENQRRQQKRRPKADNNDQQNTKHKSLSLDEAAPKLTVSNLPLSVKERTLKEKFNEYGYVLRTALGRPKGGRRPGHVFYSSHKDCEKAIAALDGSAAFGDEAVISVGYEDDAFEWAQYISELQEEILHMIPSYGWDIRKLRIKKPQIKKFLTTNSLLFKVAPTANILAAALLVLQGLSSIEETVLYELITPDLKQKVLSIIEHEEWFNKSGSVVDKKSNQATPDNKKQAKTKNEPAQEKKEKGKGNEKEKEKGKEKTNNPEFKDVIKKLDQVETERWKRFEDANKKLNERNYIRLSDILVIPGNRLWEFMSNDCKLQRAEIATCFYILNKHYDYKHSHL